MLAIATIDAPPQSDEQHTHCVVLYLEYDGTRYRGYQMQRDEPTVQDAVEKALESLTGQKYRLTSASRTDAGVHAQNQVVSFVPTKEMTLRAYESGLNHYLPHDIAVTRAIWASPSLHVRRSAVARTYRYTILNRATRSPLWDRIAALVREPLDVSAMQQAADALSGWMDVRPFTGPLPPRRTPMRRLDRAEVRRNDEFVTIELEGNSFLPHQVRRTAGALVEVGRGHMTPVDFHRLARSGTAGEADWTMPPQGLCLIGVRYDSFPIASEDVICRQ